MLSINRNRLTQIQFVLLAGLLWLSTKEQWITQIMLAKHTKVDTMTTSQVLRTLETKEYIERKPHPTDTRAKSLHLTPAGKNKVFETIPAVDKVDEDFFSNIGQKKQKCNELLQVLVDR